MAHQAGHPGGRRLCCGVCCPSSASSSCGGNAVDLAVGIVIGVAFTGVVQALVRDFINPLIAALFGKPDFRRFRFTVHHAVFRPARDEAAARV